MIDPLAFTPAREAARVDALVAAARSRGLDGPLWLLCPHEGRRGALLDRLARAGGGWIHPLDWHGLLDLVEQRLARPSLPLLSPIDRLLTIEAALEFAAVHDRPLAHALRGDALQVARAVGEVVDHLRLHGWDGAVPPADAQGVARAHLTILGRVIRALDAHLDAVGATDLPRRLAALLGASSRPALRGVLIWVEGAERLSPLERHTLSLAAACGASVSLPPWIDRADDAIDPTATADTLREALRTGAGRAASDDGALRLLTTPDVHAEAEAVASIVAAHLESGGRPEDVTVVCGPEAGAWPRVARALDRWGLPWNGGGVLPAQLTPLWQVVRASLRLAWNGPDAVDLATALTAPGSGIFGSDRDYFLSVLRRLVPTTWGDVRGLLEESTAARDDEEDPVEAEARRARGEKIRKRVGQLIDCWEAAGPLHRRSPDERADALPAVFDGAVLPFLDPESIARSVRDPRALATWLAAADAVRGSLDVARRRIASRSHRAGRLFDVDRLLTDLEGAFPVLRDGAPAARRDGVSLVGEDAWACDRPALLIVTGFIRGRFPRTPAPTLLLGPAERALLAGVSADLSALPDETTHHALARRATLRLLSSAGDRLDLLAPHRTVGGDVTELSLALRDLLDRLPADTDPAAATLSFVAPRARAAAAIELLGRGEVADAIDEGAALAHDDVAWRDLFAARFRPDADFSIGAAAGPLLRGRTHHAGDLESLATCHYRYLMTALLDLRGAPLRRRPRINESTRQAVAREVLTRLDADFASHPAVPPERVEAAIADALQQHAPWSRRPDQHAERARLADDARDLATRYLEIRRTLSGAALEAAPDEGEVRPLLSLPDGSPVLVRLPATPTLRVTGEGGAVTPVLVQLTRQRTRSLASRRDVGLDVDGALLAEAPAGGAGVVLRVNLDQALVDLMRAEGAPESVVDVLTGGAPHSDWSAKAQLSLDEHAAASRARWTEALATVDANATFAPLDPDRAASLDKVRALPCSRCEARLGCRVGLRGSAP